MERGSRVDWIAVAAGVVLVVVIGWIGSVLYPAKVGVPIGIALGVFGGYAVFDQRRRSQS